MAKRKRLGRSIDGVVFGLSTPRRHGNSRSSNFMEEAGLTMKSPDLFPETSGTSFMEMMEKLAMNRADMSQYIFSSPHQSGKSLLQEQMKTMIEEGRVTTLFGSKGAMIIKDEIE